MKVKAWIQMGGERRVTVFELPEDQVRKDSNGIPLELHIEALVREWLETQFGWGWSGGGWENDFTFMEGSDGVGSVIIAEEAVPNTRVAHRQAYFRPSLEEWIERQFWRPQDG